MDGYGARSPRVNRAPRNRGSGRRAILEITSNVRRYNEDGSLRDDRITIDQWFNR